MDWISQALLLAALVVAGGHLFSRRRGMDHGVAHAGYAAPGIGADQPMPAQNPETALEIDPVSHNAVPLNAVVAVAVHNGSVYYFESHENQKRFEADPATFLASLPTEAVRTGAGAGAVPSTKPVAPRRRHGCC